MGYNTIVIGQQIGYNSYNDAKVPFQTSSLFVIITTALVVANCLVHRERIKNSFSSYFKVNRLPIICSIVYMIMSLLLGSREYTISLGLLFLFTYTAFVRKIKIGVLVPTLVCAIIGTYSISIIRSGQSFDIKSITERKAYQNSNVNPLWNVATDLIINNRNLYVGMEYVDDARHGYTYGYHYLPTLFAPLPFIPDLFSTYLLGKPAVQFTSQQILTDYTRDELGHSDLDYELGSNCVVDVYMAWGIIGVAVMFFLLGKAIKYISVRMYSNAYYCTIYTVLLTGSVFFCRGGFWGSLRNVVWGVILVWILLKINKSEKHFGKYFNSNNHNQLC